MIESSYHEVYKGFSINTYLDLDKKPQVIVCVIANEKLHNGFKMVFPAKEIYRKYINEYHGFFAPSKREISESTTYDVDGVLDKVVKNARTIIDYLDLMREEITKQNFDEYWKMQKETEHINQLYQPIKKDT